MSTDLKSRSKAYELTRVSLRGIGNVGVAVSHGSLSACTFSIETIQAMFADNDFSRLAEMGFLEETVERLMLDLAQFAISKGDGMEAY